MLHTEVCKHRKSVLWKCSKTFRIVNTFRRDVKLCHTTVTHRHLFCLLLHSSLFREVSEWHIGSISSWEQALQLKHPLLPVQSYRAQTGNCISAFQILQKKIKKKCWKCSLLKVLESNMIFSYYNFCFNHYVWDFWKLINFRFLKPKHMLSHLLSTKPVQNSSMLLLTVKRIDTSAFCNKRIEFYHSFSFSSSYNLQLEWMLTNV